MLDMKGLQGGAEGTKVDESRNAGHTSSVPTLNPKPFVLPLNIQRRPVSFLRRNPFGREV